MASATNYHATPIKSTAVATSTGTTSKKTPPKPSVVQWQSTAWTFYDSIGEFRYAVDWIGHLLSRVKLIVTKDGEPTEDAKAVDLLDALFGGPDGQADMLRQIGKHWTVAGDCYIIGDNVESETDADWLIGAATQTTFSEDNGWKVNKETFKKSALVIRLWRPHPTDRTISDSPTQAVLPILSEIDGLTKYVAAQVDSRLAGNGILLLPAEMSFGSATPETPVDGTGADDPPAPRRDASAFVDELIAVASAAIADREDPNSLIPIVLQAEGEQLQYARHLTFSSDLQTQAIELRTEAIRRLALGMDMPPEILTGTSDMNHWSSWQIEEAAIKSHLEPLLDEICASLTVGYLRDALGDGKDTASYAIAADTTAIRLRPNRSKEALELADRGKLSDEALLRENGFDPKADAMDDKGYQRWLTTKIASGSASPEEVDAALKLLGVDLGVQVAPAAGGSGTNETRPTPTTRDHPTQTAPEAKDPAPSAAPGATPRANAPATPQKPAGGAAIDDRVVFAGAIMVDRALERAGNRIKTKLDAKIRDRNGEEVPAAQVYRYVKVDSASSTLNDLLTDAWSTCERWSDDLAVDSGWLSRTLDGYARGILQHAQPHSAEALRAYLADAL